MWGDETKICSSGHEYWLVTREAHTRTRTRTRTINYQVSHCWCCWWGLRNVLRFMSGECWTRMSWWDSRESEKTKEDGATVKIIDTDNSDNNWQCRILEQPCKRCSARREDLYKVDYLSSLSIKWESLVSGELFVPSYPDVLLAGGVWCSVLLWCWVVFLTTDGTDDSYVDIDGVVT